LVPRIADPDVPVEPDAVAPEAGAAVANAIGYNWTLWAIVWKCSYAGWQSGTAVTWSCKLRDQVSGALYSAKSGSFSGGSLNPGPWYYFTGPFRVCVYAEAHYTNWGSVKDTHTRCQIAGT